MEAFLQVYTGVWALLVGLVLGSFLNVVIYRVPRGNFFAEQRSFCPHCHAQLGARDLIPVFSFLFLRGRCRHCKEPISWRYPLVELFCGGLAVLCLWRFGLSWQALFAFFLFLILTAVSLIDFDTMEIPDLFHVVLLPFAVAAIWLWPEVSLGARLIGLVAVSLPMLILTILIADAFGGGDIKLMAVCGFLLGYANTLLAFFIALLVGGVCAVVLLIQKRKQKGAARMMPFGPSLCAGVAVALLFGKELLGWYLSLFL